MRHLCLAFAVFALLLQASGCKKSSSATVSSPLAHRSVPTEPASAEQVAQEMRGDVKCPAKASTEPASNTPVSDVVGIRPGMPVDEAAHFVLCDDPHLVVAENNSRGYTINTFGQHIRQGFDAKFAEARVVRSSTQIMQDMEESAMRRSGNAYVAPLKPGQLRYYVSSMGLPGQEKVMSVAREEYFADGKQPAVDSVKQALIAKYGEPTQMNASGTVTYLWWEYDPTDNKIVAGSQLAGTCRVNVSPDSGTNVSTACGTQVGALIQGTNANPGLAYSLAVTAQDGARDYALLRDTEVALRKADDARKAAELSNATKSATTPKL